MPVDGYAGFAAHLAALAAACAADAGLAAGAVRASGCLGWPTPASNPQRRLPPASTPTLLVNARHDPATPYAWARNVAAQLGPQATLLTYDGWGHVGVRPHRLRERRAVDRYLIELRRPPPGRAAPA